MVIVAEGFHSTQLPVDHALGHCIVDFDEADSEK